jgi:hypothetical protein
LAYFLFHPGALPNHLLLSPISGYGAAPVTATCSHG